MAKKPDVAALEQRIADLKAERDALAQRVISLENETAVALEWRPINLPFSEMCRAVIDPARLIGLEIEVDGKVYLIGDVNTNAGQRGGNVAFMRDAVVTRARVRVQK